MRSLSGPAPEAEMKKPRRAPESEAFKRTFSLQSHPRSGFLSRNTLEARHTPHPNKASDGPSQMPVATTKSSWMFALDNQEDL